MDRWWHTGYKWRIVLFLSSGIFLALAFMNFPGSESQDHPSKEVEASHGSTSVSVLIVPHHLAADSFIDAAFQTVSEKIDAGAVNRVILLSPNHFEVGRDWIIGANRNWETPSGTLDADVRALQKLRGSIFVGDTILDREHGVRNIFPFIKKYFPNAAVAPLALRDGIPNEDVRTFTERLDLLSDTHTLLVVSADFSHYLDWNFSQFHDDEAIEVLSRNDLPRVDTLDVDCSGCLRVAMQYASLRNASNFRLLSRSSSLSMLGSNIVGSETSHITGYFSSEAPPSGRDSTSARLLFSGSILPWQMTEQSRRIFMAQDEDVFEEGGKTRMGVFHLDSERMMSDIEQVMDSDASFSLRAINGERMAFIGADAESRSSEDIAKDISNAKEEGDNVIVLWRNSSFSPDIARMYVDAGADLVIGKNKSLIESAEVYRGKLIFPSLGNDFSDCHKSNENCLGIIFGVEFSHANTKYVFMPIHENGGEDATLAIGNERKNALENLSRHVMDPSLRAEILEGILSLPGDK